MFRRSHKQYSTEISKALARNVSGLFVDTHIDCRWAQAVHNGMFRLRSVKRNFISRPNPVHVALWAIKPWDRQTCAVSCRYDRAVSSDEVSCARYHATQTVYREWNSSLNIHIKVLNYCQLMDQLNANICMISRNVEPIAFHYTTVRLMKVVWPKVVHSNRNWCATHSNYEMLYN